MIQKAYGVSYLTQKVSFSAKGRKVHSFVEKGIKLLMSQLSLLVDNRWG